MTAGKHMSTSKIIYKLIWAYQNTFITNPFRNIRMTYFPKKISLAQFDEVVRCNINNNMSSVFA